MSLRRHGVHSELAWRRGQQMEQMHDGEEFLSSPTRCSPSVRSSPSKEKVSSGRSVPSSSLMATRWQSGDINESRLFPSSASRVLTHNPVQQNLCYWAQTPEVTPCRMWAFALIYVCFYHFSDQENTLVTSELLWEITQTSFFQCVRKIYMLVLVLLCWCLIDFLTL